MRARCAFLEEGAATGLDQGRDPGFDLIKYILWFQICVSRRCKEFSVHICFSIIHIV